MKTKLIVLLCAVGIAAIVIAMQVRDDHRAASVEKIHRLCLGVKIAMEDDARAFESGDPKKQEVALDRFYEGDSIYHSAQGILYCIEPEKVPSVGMCILNKNYKCLADIAEKIAGQL